MLTLSQLKLCLPGLDSKKATLYYPFLVSALKEFGIDTDLRVGCFLAQIGHESGDLRWLVELWGPTDAQKRYDPPSSLATKLGNTKEHDGFLYRGRGPIQLTGRSNYRIYSKKLGLDLEGNPERAKDIDVIFRVAGQYWKDKGLNELSDLNTDTSFEEITRRINGGFNGLADRVKRLAVVKTVLGL